MNRLKDLQALAIQCIEYVGSANYTEREQHALRELRRGFRQFLNGENVEPMQRDTSEDES